SERDQFLRAKCARWLVDLGRSADLPVLLGARSVEARLAALGKVTDEDLIDACLLTLLVDRSPRVRNSARWRASRRGVDVVEFYPLRLTGADRTPALGARCLDGLTAWGAAKCIDLFRSHLSHDSSAVRAAAAAGVGRFATGRDSAETLTPLLVDPSPKVCSS